LPALRPGIPGARLDPPRNQSERIGEADAGAACAATKSGAAGKAAPAHADRGVDRTEVFRRDQVFAGIYTGADDVLKSDGQLGEIIVLVRQAQLQVETAVVKGALRVVGRLRCIVDAVAKGYFGPRKNLKCSGNAIIRIMH